MRQLLETTILGITQGLTEWLPISSSGHFRLLNTLFGLEAPISLNGVFHLGTLIVTVVFFRKEIARILSSTAHLDFQSEHGRLFPLIVVGSIPTALIGLILGWTIEETFQSVPSLALAFLASGVLLYISKFSEEKGSDISCFTALLLGAVQGIAIIPGITRSGATISIALLLGTRRDAAFRFSFLLSIPSILGASVYTAYAEFGKLAVSGMELTWILAGGVVTVITGYIALTMLWKTIVKDRFHLFSLYCWLLGTILLLSLVVS